VIGGAVVVSRRALSSLAGGLALRSLAVDLLQTQPKLQMQLQLQGLAFWLSGWLSNLLTTSEPWTLLGSPINAGLLPFDPAAALTFRMCSSCTMRRL
jgi:hypothetical protein